MPTKQPPSKAFLFQSDSNQLFVIHINKPEEISHGNMWHQDVWDLIGIVS